MAPVERSVRFGDVGPGRLLHLLIVGCEVLGAPFEGVDLADPPSASRGCRPHSNRESPNSSNDRH